MIMVLTGAFAILSDSPQMGGLHHPPDPPLGLHAGPRGRTVLVHPGRAARRARHRGMKLGRLVDVLGGYGGRLALCSKAAEVAERHRLAVLLVDPAISWSQLAGIVYGLVMEGRETAAGRGPTDLFALADNLADEAARFLGIGTDTLWALVEGGHLTVVNLPTGVQRRSPRFRIDDLKAAVESWVVRTETNRRNAAGLEGIC
jgi:hypothetical protein